MNKGWLYIIVALIVGTSFMLWKSTHVIVVPTNSFDTIVVGTNAEFQPFSFKDDNNVIVGFDIDVITEVVKRLDKKMTIKDMPFDALIPEIQLGNIHVVAGGITPTQERAQRTLFTDPHLTSDSLVVISLVGNPVKSIDELRGKTVVVNEGYTADAYMSDQQGVNLVRISANSVSDGILALQSGRANAYVTALHPMKPYFDKYGTNQFVITPIEGTEESSAFAVSKHYPELRSFIQITLDRMEEDGTLNSLKKKWGLA